MGNISRVKVELRKNTSEYTSKYDEERAFKSLFTAFKRICTEAGIAHQSKKYERYEKPSEIRHKKKREKLLEQSKRKRNSNPRSKKRK